MVFDMSQKAKAKPFTLHPMKVHDALRVMLNTPPMKKRKRAKS
jgi:hypothetical protein